MTDDELNNTEIIHDACGLNIELCVCPDSTFYWDDENGCIKKRVQKEPDDINNSYL
jgi:hypothetical protein